MAHRILPHAQAASSSDLALQQAIRDASAEQHLTDLGVAQLKLLALQGDMNRQVAQLRMEGVSWSRIASAIGISTQAAHQRWSVEGVEKHRLRQRRLNRGDTEDAK